LPQDLLSVAALVIGLAALVVNAWRGRSFITLIMDVVHHRI
jgi:hypothetical protein